MQDKYIYMMNLLVNIIIIVNGVILSSNGTPTTLIEDNRLLRLPQIIIFPLIYIYISAHCWAC